MKRISAILSTLLVLAAPAQAYTINNYWPDDENVVMDDVFQPAATWSTPAQLQLTEWNTIDVTNNSHPFRINTAPQMSFGADDGDNTMGFLGGAGLNNQYGLTYARALAWTICYAGRFFSNRYDECDITIDPARAWQTTPHNRFFFQSTMLHEAGHVRGLGHYNTWLSMMNSGVDKLLRDETLYMDDRHAIRQNATTTAELDIAMYRKWHNGAAPRWMTMGPTRLRVGDRINFQNIAVENRGSRAFNAVRFGIYLSTNDVISTADTQLNTGNFNAFAVFTHSAFNWNATIPNSITDCGQRFIGGIIDDDSSYAERYENNNAVAFSNGTVAPTPLDILLARDGAEPNDTRATARAIALDYSNANLSIDQDNENDYYRFDLSDESDVRVEAFFTHARGDVNLQLLDASGAVLASSTSTSNNERIDERLAAGTYYVRVWGNGAGSCNPYQLDVESTAVCDGRLMAGEVRRQPARVEVDYTFWVHHKQDTTVRVALPVALFDQDGTRIGQRMHRPHRFETGDLVEHSGTLRAPADLEPGVYLLKVAVDGMNGFSTLSVPVEIP